LHIGVKSDDYAGLHTSTPAKVGCLLSASDIANDKIPEPTKEVYDQIIELLNQYITGGGSGEGVDLRDYQKKVDDGLETTNKTIVGAINEVNKKTGQSSGGGLTEEEVREIVAETAITQESDPTVSDWAKEPTKPSYTAQEVGALPSDTPLFSGDYNDLTNKPAIPSTEGLATKEYVDDKLGDINTALETILGV
jgi:hypothetical protein